MEDERPDLIQGNIIFFRQLPNGRRPFAERWVRSAKEECLSKLILFGEASLLRALNEFVGHFHAERNHQGSSRKVGAGDLATRRYIYLGEVTFRETSSFSSAGAVASSGPRKDWMGDFSENRTDAGGGAAEWGALPPYGRARDDQPFHGNVNGGFARQTSVYVVPEPG